MRRELLRRKSSEHLTVYEIGAEGDVQFIATEFIEGTTLRAARARENECA